MPAAIEQPVSELAASIAQFNPEFVGRVSVSVRFLAIPVPVLVTVMVYPIGSPAVTVAASAVFVIVRSGQFTVIAAPSLLSVGSRSTVDDTVAVLVSAPQSAASVAP